MTGKPVKYKEFVGIRNTVPAQQLGPTELAAAVNVDINDAKRLRRRTGRASFSAGAADSLFSDGSIALCRRNNALRQLLADGSTAVLRSGVNGRIAYCAHDGRIYWSDGIVNGVVEEDSDGPWGVEVPTTQPDYASAVGGNLPRGRYLYAVTYLRDGLESGTGPSGETAEIEGTIEFSNIPVPADADEKALYISRPNGRELYRAMTLPAATTEASYAGDTADLGAILETQLKQPPPPAGILAEHNGRILLGVGRHLLYSDPYRPDLFDPVRQAYTMDSALQIIAPVQGGVFVGTEKQIVYLSGDDIAQAGQDVKAEYGAVQGTVDYTEAQHFGGLEVSGRVAVFASRQGICLGGNGGAFINMTLNRYAYPVARSGAGVVRLEDGANRYVAALRGV